MTILDDVNDLILTLTPNAICDDCITLRLNLSVRQHANIKTRELASRHGFERRKGICSGCGGDKKVISRVL